MKWSSSIIVLLAFILAPSVILAEDGFSWQGLCDFRFLSSSSQQEGRTRFNTDSKSFDIGRLALALSKKVRPGLDFYTHLEFQPTMNSARGQGLSVSEAWLKFNPCVGEFSGRFGTYALPFTLAQGEPMRTTTWTITPSALDTFYEGMRISGLEFTKGYDVPGNHFNWQFGGGSGVDNVTLFDRNWSFSDEPPTARIGEIDGSMAFYGYIGKFRSDSCNRGRLSWHTGFFINDGQGDGPVGNCDDTFFMLFDCQFWKHYWGLVVQGMLGTSQRAGVRQDADVSNFSAWAKVNNKLSGFLRYDHFNLETEVGNTVDRGHGFTVAFTYILSKEELLQVEWLEPSVAVGTGQRAKAQWQVRYRVHF